MHLKPIRDKLLVQLVKEENKLGLILPSENKKGKKLEQGIIVNLGDEVKEPIRSAKRVLFDHFAGTPVTLNDEEYIMMKSEDIHAVVR